MAQTADIKLNTISGFDQTREHSNFLQMIGSRFKNGNAFMQTLGAAAEIGLVALKTIAGFSETAHAGTFAKQIAERFDGLQRMAPALATVPAVSAFKRKP